MFDNTPQLQFICPLLMCIKGSPLLSPSIMPSSWLPAISHSPLSMSVSLFACRIHTKNKRRADFLRKWKPALVMFPSSRQPVSQSLSECNRIRSTKQATFLLVALTPVFKQQPTLVWDGAREGTTCMEPRQLHAFTCTLGMLPGPISAAQFAS